MIRLYDYVFRIIIIKKKNGEIVLVQRYVIMYEEEE